MITIKNVKTLDDQVIDHKVPSARDFFIDADGKLLLMPGLIDPHICLGAARRGERNWDVIVSSVIRSGVTSLVDIPCKDFRDDTKQQMEKKREWVEKGLADLGVSLNCFFYANGNPEGIERLGSIKREIKGVVIQINSSNGEGLNQDWEPVFRMAAWENLPVVVNANNENQSFENNRYLKMAIDLAEKENVRLYVLNVGTREEIELINEARKRALLIYAETTPLQLFLDSSNDNDFLWEALKEGVIETIGSGFNATMPDKNKVDFRGSHFSPMDPIFLLPRLLTARRKGKISMEKIIRATAVNVQEILNVEDRHDLILVDLEKEDSIEFIHDGISSKQLLCGWPAYTIAGGQVFSSPKCGCHLIHHN